VVDSDIAAFIERNGLARYQAADTLMKNEITYGRLGSIPVDTWQEVGLPEDEAELFATDVAHSHTLHSCPECEGEKDHPSPLKMATEIIDTLYANDRQRRAEWLTVQTRETRQRRRRRRMATAIRYSESRRETDSFLLAAEVNVDGE
jgi:hypothetical protein